MLIRVVFIAYYVAHVSYNALSTCHLVIEKQFIEDKNLVKRLWLLLFWWGFDKNILLEIQMDP